MYLRLSHMPNAILHHEPTVLSPAYYYGKKKSKRVGRPPGGHSNLEGGVKRRGRRRKRRKQLFVHKKRRSSASVDNTPAGSPQVTDTFPSYKWWIICIPGYVNRLNSAVVFALGSTGQWRGRGSGWRWLTEWRLWFRAAGWSPGWLWAVVWQVPARHAISLPTGDTQTHTPTPETSLTLILWWWKSPSLTKGSRCRNKFRTDLIYKTLNEKSKICPLVFLYWTLQSTLCFI